MNAAAVPVDVGVARRWRRWSAWIDGLPDLPSRLALRLLNAAPFRRRLADRYSRSLDAHRTSRPVLKGIDRAIVEGMERDGVFITSIGALGLAGSRAMLETTCAAANAWAETVRARVREGSDFNVLPASVILEHPEIFDWGVSARLLDIARAYLGVPVAYDGVSINYTVADGRAVSTRQWHRDWEDRRMLKVAIYCNDVDGDGGPFQMIKRVDGNQNDVNGYRYGPVSDAALRDILGGDFEDDTVSCEGPAGTVVFTDTARFFHRGKPAVARDRVAIFHSYFARPPRHPFFCERSGLSRAHLAKLAARLDPRQRESILWRRSLSMPLRLVPPARI